MDYLLITEQQVQKKYNSLPDKIRNVLDLENNVMVVEQICRQHHLDDERILIVNQLIALILLGFVSPNDFRQEIMDNTHLNYQHSDDITKEIYEKIFALIRSEIDKIYSPVEILTKESAPVAEVKEKKDTIDLRIFEKQKSEEEIKKPIEIKEEAPVVPLPIEVISKTEIEPVGPLIIHKEIETKPTLGKQRSLGGLFGFLKAQKEGEKIQEQKPITAEVEIPIIEAPKPPKVVHYSDLKTPVSKPTTNNQQLTTDNRQPITTIKLPEVPMPPKSEIKSEIKNKVFESEIEKAKVAGLIMNNQQSAISNQQFNIEDIPIEIEEVPRQNFLNKIFKFLTGLFVTKKKIIREVPEQKENLISKLAQEKNKEEIEEIKEKPKEFEFPLEIKFSGPPKKEPELPNSEIPELKTDIFKTKEIEPSEINLVISRAEGEIKEKSQPIMTQSEKPETQDKEVIDLRTFQMIKK